MAYKRFSEEERKNYREKQIEEAANRMNNYINEMQDTDKFKDFLKTTSKFHNYSMRNIVLISQQNPEATYVSGYNNWKNNFDRQVQKGAQGIKILAPIVKKLDHDVLDPNGKVIRDDDGKPVKEKRPTIVGYKTQNVFDISDTKGKPLTTARDLVQDKLSKSNDYKNLYEEFRDTLNQKDNITVQEKTADNDEILEKGANGYYSPTQDLIVIDNNQSFDNKFRVLIHEYAHFKLDHGKSNLELSRGEKELQAESSAFIVADYYNLDTSDYSVGYSATWNRDDKDTIIQYLNEIKSFASETIEEINTMPNFERVITQEQLKGLSKEEENDLTKMIDRNLKNGFDKMPIIEGNLQSDFKMNKAENGYENDKFKVNIEYKGFNTKNDTDRCKVTVTNKIDDEVTAFNFKQNYNLNKVLLQS